MDHQKLMLAGPVFFLLGLVSAPTRVPLQYIPRSKVVGLGLFCSAFIRRRRNRHSRLPSYGASLAPIPRKLAPPNGAKYPARSVLAARTAANTCLAQNGPIGFPTMGVACFALFKGRPIPSPPPSRHCLARAGLVPLRTARQPPPQPRRSPVWAQGQVAADNTKKRASRAFDPSLASQTHTFLPTTRPASSWPPQMGMDRLKMFIFEDTPRETMHNHELPALRP
jgi:hypothetical protein